MPGKTKYEAIADELRGRIAKDYLPADRFPTETALAKSFGVSIMTVRQALQLLVAEGLIIRKQGKGTVVAGADGGSARGLGKSKKSILFVTIGQPDIFVEEITLIQREFSRLGYMSMLHNIDWSNSEHVRQERLDEALRISEPAGIICGSVAHCCDDATRLMERVVLPVVYVQPYKPMPGSYVVVNMGTAAYEAARHLYEIGAQRIRYFGPTIENCNDWVWDREGGLKKFLAEFRPGESLEDFSVTAERTVDGGYRALAQEYATGQVPDGILASNDNLAIGVMLAAREFGIRIPEDVALIGVDNILDAATTVPPLTTMAQPKLRVAQEVVRIMDECVTQPGARRNYQVVLEPALIIRQSTVNLTRKEVVVTGRMKAEG